MRPARKYEEQLNFVPLDTAKHDRGAFHCGIDPLDRYLKTQASQDVRRYVAAAFVLTPDDRTIAGYCTISQHAIDAQELPVEIATGLRLPRYSLIPATLIGRLAVARSYQNMGIGELLLFNALNRILKLSRSIASAAVVVDANDDSAANFYSRYGFARVPDEPSRLLLTMEAIESMFR